MMYVISCVAYTSLSLTRRYLDMFRDKKEVAEEVIKEHLSELSPYVSEEEQTPLYPLAAPTKPGLYADQLPATWIQDNLRHKANKTYKYKYVHKGDWDWCQCYYYKYILKYVRKTDARMDYLL